MQKLNVQTLNTNEDIPEFFYIFTDRNLNRLSNKVEKHNIALRGGTLISAGFSNLLIEDKREAFLRGDLDYLPFVPNKTTTVGPISPFLSRVTERYTLEYNMEVFRMNNHKTYPSRFSGIFAFGSMEDCRDMAKASKSWDINTVKNINSRI